LTPEIRHQKAAIMAGPVTVGAKRAIPDAPPGGSRESAAGFGKRRHYRKTDF
jgi:hypothetical protein